VAYLEFRKEEGKSVGLWDFLGDGSPPAARFRDRGSRKRSPLEAVAYFMSSDVRKNAKFA